MTMAQAVLTGLGLIAAAIFVGGSTAPQAQTGQFLILASSLSSPSADTKTFIAWRMNAGNGAISYCLMEAMPDPPKCSQWSK